jgi:hypothetical protein
MQLICHDTYVPAPTHWQIYDQVLTCLTNPQRRFHQTLPANAQGVRACLVAPSKASASLARFRQNVIDAKGLKNSANLAHRFVSGDLGDSPNQMV